MANITRPKYIDFVLYERKPKTDVYDIKSKESGDLLGQVKWFSRWRKYAFFPVHKTVWEQECLGDVIAFLNKLKEERKEKLKSCLTCGNKYMTGYCDNEHPRTRCPKWIKEKI